MAAPWNTQLNSLTTRADLVEQYGGSRYSGGIVPALASNNVFLFSDPSEGVKYGYNFDGPGETKAISIQRKALSVTMPRPEITALCLGTLLQAVTCGSLLQMDM